MKHHAMLASWGLAGLLVCSSGLTGCQSFQQPGGTSLASVKIAGATPVAIWNVTDRVFREAGYNLVQTKPDTHVYEQPGSRADALKYGGWDGAGVVMRATVTTEPMGNLILVRCDVAAVRDYHDRLREDENRVAGGYRRQYQNLLDEVQRHFPKQ